MQTTEIIDTPLFNGHAAFAVDYGDGSPVTLDYYSGSGLFTVPPSKNNPTAFMIMKYPLDSGETLIVFDSTTPDKNRNLVKMIYQGDKKTVTVPAGTFSCYQYDVISLEGIRPKLDTVGKQEYYLSPGIGIIENKIYGMDTPTMLSRDFVNELISYRVN